jgi:SAM-dependent methyltransferase
MADKEHPLDFEVVERCPLCGGVGIYYARSTDGRHVVNMDKCVECGVLYQNPRMTEASSLEYYASEKYHREYSPAGGPDSRITRILSILQGMEIDPKRVLDYGCGRGYLLKAIQNVFTPEIVGYDVTKYRGSVVSDKYRTDDRDSIEGKFDLITCVHVLEHLYDPHDALRWIKERVAPGGTIYLEVPFDDKIYLPHVYNFDNMSFRYMLERVEMNALYLELDPNLGIYLVGDRYKNMNIQRIVGIANAYTLWNGVYR